MAAQIVLTVCLVKTLSTRLRGPQKTEGLGVCPGSAAFDQLDYVGPIHDGIGRMNLECVLYDPETPVDVDQIRSMVSAGFQ